MLIWLIGVIALVLVWGMLWQRNFMLSVGILIGLPVAWVLSILLRPYVTGMEHIPLWLPPLPFATVATILFVYGGLTWWRADRLPPPPPETEDEEHGHH